MCCCDDDDGRRKSNKLGRRKSLFHSNIITNASDNNCHSTLWTNSLICVNHFQNKCRILSTCCFKNCFQTNLHHSMLVGLGANSLSNSNPSSRYLGNWTKKFCGMSPKLFCGTQFIFKCAFCEMHSKYMWKMSIQYPAPGFELTTFWLRVSSLNH